MRENSRDLEREEICTRNCCTEIMIFSGRHRKGLMGNTVN